MALAELVAQRRHKIGHSEDALNVEVVSLLRFSGIMANHDVKYGGHADISVKLGDDFLWIAEAKLWKGCAWAFSGLKQLGRYMSGLPGQDRGAVILYVFKPDAAGLLKSWRTELAKLVTRYVDINEVEPLKFQSKHIHLAAGSTILVDHIAVPLFWDSASLSV